MAIEQQQIMDILNAEGDAEAKTGKLLGIFEADVAAQLNTILVNKEEILTEKRNEAAKRKALEEQLEQVKEENVKLQKQLDNSSPDEVKKIFEQRMNDASSIYEKRLADNASIMEQQKKRIQELEYDQLKLECTQEFQRVIANKDIASDSISPFADFVLGPNCCYFDHRPIGDGKTILATKDGMTIEAAVKAALETTFGKKCVVVKSSGGGAGGGTRSGVAGVSSNPFAKGSVNLTEQMRLFREDRELYNQLKAQAQA